jgi:hypothetical protein
VRRTSPEGGVSPRARRTPPKGGREPSSEADLTRGGREPSSEADLTRGGVWPSSEADFARGGRFAALPWLAVGATTLWIVLCACVRLEVSLHFAFFAGFKRDSPSYLGDPYGCPRHAPRSTIKSQVLADFVAEWTEIQTPPASIEHETWIMYFDGSIMKEGAGVCLVFILPLGVRMEYLVRLHFPTSNNAAEYEALINYL